MNSPNRLPKKVVSSSLLWPFFLVYALCANLRVAWIWFHWNYPWDPWDGRWASHRIPPWEVACFIPVLPTCVFMCGTHSVCVCKCCSIILLRNPLPKSTEMVLVPKQSTTGPERIHGTWLYMHPCMVYFLICPHLPLKNQPCHVGRYFQIFPSF